MGLIKSLFGEKSAPEPAKTPEGNLDKARKLAQYVAEHTKVPMITIKTEPAENLSIFSGKFGGYPYWPAEKEYPCNKDGEKLILLAQINFAEMNVEHEDLPKEGILQFFIECSDCYGLNFDDFTDQNTFRVVFHEKVDQSVTIEQVKTLGIRANTELDYRSDPFPLYGELALSYVSDTDTMKFYLEEYGTKMSEALEVLYGEKLDGSIYKHFTDEEYDVVASYSEGFGHKIFGYPSFTQEDPRSGSSEYTYEEFDTLLLQVDSEGNDLCWGDSGVCNFFINREALKKRDFSRVLYNWDCY